MIDAQKIEKPCRAYAKGQSCRDGRDHCFNCGRHLNPENSKCPKGCGEGNDAIDDAANNEE
jgi:hypothetical protein